MVARIFFMASWDLCEVAGKEFFDAIGGKNPKGFAVGYAGRAVRIRW
jgi:hypothetical protein